MFSGKRVAVLFLLVWAFAPHAGARSDTAEPKNVKTAARTTAGNPAPRPKPPTSRLLNTSEGLSVIAAALESRVPQPSRPDCSHLVHAIYERAGFPYTYASSSDLYAGSGEFRRIFHPQPGDLVVWPGHVGIVVNPVQHVFFSSLRTGRGIESYDAPYWKGRGRARYYRYVKRLPTVEHANDMHAPVLIHRQQ